MAGGSSGEDACAGDLGQLATVGAGRPRRRTQDAARSSDNTAAGGQVDLILSERIEQGAPEKRRLQVVPTAQPARIDRRW